MDWNQEQVNKYGKLRDRCAEIDDLIRVAKLCFEVVETAPSAGESAIEQLRRKVGHELPPPLVQFLRASNGLKVNGISLIFSAEQAVREIEQARVAAPEHYMSMEDLIFCGRAGNGDLFAFPVMQNRTVRNHLLRWDHENDDRTWYAQNLKDLLIRFSVFTG